jgi:mannosyltransferase
VANVVDTERAVASPPVARSRRDWLAVAVPAALGAVAPLPILVRWPLGHTEAVSVDIAHRSIPQIMQLLRHTDAPLGAYYLLMHFWIRLGDSAVIVRVPSLFFAVAGVVVTVLLGRRVFGTKVGVAAGLMLAVCPLVVASAAEARPYSLMMALSACSTLLFLRAVENPTRSSRALYAIVSVFAVYSHLFAALTILAHIIALALRGRRVWRPLVSSYLVIGAAALPLFGFVATQQSKEVAWIPPMSLHQVTTTATQLAGGAALLLSTALLAIYAARMVAARWIRHRDSADWQRVAIGICLVTPPAVALVASIAKPLLLERYLIGSLPPLAIMTMAGAFALPRYAWRGGAVVVVAALMASSLWQTTHRSFRVDDAKHAVAGLAADSQPGDVVTFAPSELRVLFDYYLNRLPPDRAHRIVDVAVQRDAASAHTLYATEISSAALAKELATKQRIWIVGDDALPVRASSIDDPVVAFERSPAFAAYTVAAESRYGTMFVRLYVRTAPLPTSH